MLACMRFCKSRFNGDEDSDGDGIPNALEVANLTNPFDADDVDPCPYLWLKNGEAMESLFDEGDIGYDTLLTYWIKAQTNCPPIMVRVNEGGHVVESFHVTWDDNITCTWLNSRQRKCPPGFSTRAASRSAAGISVTLRMPNAIV